MRTFYPVLLAAALAACSAANQAAEAPKPDPAAYAAAFHHLGDAEPIEFPGHITRVMVGQGDTPSQVSLLELTVPARSVGAPPHTHADEDEYFIVLEGNVVFLNEDEQVAAPPGTIAALPRGHMHAFWNPTDEPASLLLAIAPGQFETFFDEVVMKIRIENADSPERIGAIIGETAAARNVIVEPARFPQEALDLLPQ